MPKEISLDLAEETGWHIGDGSMNFYKSGSKIKGLYQLRGHIKDDKEHYEKRIKPLFDKLFGTNINIRFMPSTSVIGFQIWNDDLVNFKRSLGLPLGGKAYVRIPSIFLSDKKLCIAVLWGIFDTDGGIYLERKNSRFYPRMYITTISAELSEQIMALFKKLDFRITRHSQYYPRGMNRKVLYVLTLRGVEMFHKFMKEICPMNPKHQRKYVYFLTHKTYK